MKLIVILCLTFTFIFPQQGKYKRKSVSSLESIWIKDGALSGVSNFDNTTFDKFIDFYVEVERFDYNVLPKSWINKFRKEAKTKSEVTPISLPTSFAKVPSSPIKSTILDSYLTNSLSGIKTTVRSSCVSSNVKDVEIWKAL